MLLTYREALNILRLAAAEGTERPDPSTVQTAFERMSRRYPAEQFPEKFRVIRNAYDVLTDADSYWRKIILDDEDFTWLAPFVKVDLPLLATPLQKIAGNESEREFLEEIMRATIAVGFDDEIPF